MLRSHGVPDRAALEAVRPVAVLAGPVERRPEKFILAVVVSFRLRDVKK